MSLGPTDLQTSMWLSSCFENQPTKLMLSSFVSAMPLTGQDFSFYVTSQVLMLLGNEDDSVTLSDRYIVGLKLMVRLHTVIKRATIK